MHTVISVPQHKIRPSVHWTVKEKRNGLYVPVREFDNLVTNVGLTALAAAPSGNYLAPIYLVIETSFTVMSLAGSIGDGSIQIVADPTIGGDTQLVVGVGLSSQETVTFSSKNDLSGLGTGPWVFTLTGTLVNNHLITDQVVRAPNVADTMASVLVEAQYDPINNPNQRVAMAGSFSPGTGQNTMQFFMTGLTAQNIYFAHVGLTDQQSILSVVDNLHNYASLGYNNNTGADLEIDAQYTLQIY